MSDMTIAEIKAFVPARDFALSKQFYEDLGFTIAWSDSDLSYLRCGACSFLLQNFYHPEHAGNFMMHLLVDDVEAWWRHVEKKQPPRCGDGVTRTGNWAYWPFSHPLVRPLRSHPLAPAACFIRRRVEWRSRTREVRAPARACS